ncbi:hypothetical protein PP175_27540 (plasmid) [Aneurinibacillus sp. Ricciae_BoGa-3]|uniref:hypothetical protein n=1 Tax=Aneurinibacillus sp. Ricciae_BoGa-3 TaxID=3022697 RepID=UPI00233FE2D5|nr:hypothetical protein [Aneurinibacillus sp. Ricciae_BoGa-3]WCK56947.1 hypothetical protein PP175_27540 [Aneurinibacillus sp. Ricciae_BoGa-3]
MKKIGLLVFILLLTLCMGVPAFASTTNTFSTQAVAGIAQPQTNTQSSSPTTATNVPSIQPAVDNAVKIPKVSIDQATAWGQKKAYDVVHFLQKVIEPIAIIFFILCAVMSMAGSFGNSQLVGRGMWGMAISVVVYAGILYAPELMNFTVGWLASK